MSCLLAVVIECEVPGDLKQPGPHLGVRGLGNGASTHAQEHILRQIARRLGMTDRPVEIPDQAMLVGRKKGLQGP